MSDQKSDGEKQQSTTEKSVEQGDKELSELLDSALADFRDEPGASDGAKKEKSVSLDPSEIDPNAFMTQEMAQKAARDFHNMLSQLAQIQEAAVKTNPEAQSAAPSAVSETQPNSAAADNVFAGEEPVLNPERLLHDLHDLSEKAGKVASASDSQEFSRSMNELHSAGFETDLMPFMHGLMTSLMSKEVMYPSVKEMSQQLPAWIEKNEHTLEQGDKERYGRMLQIMETICKEYEVEKDDDTDSIRSARCERQMLLMGQLQLCGQPPAELIGDMPPGWQVDPATGMPKVVDTNAAATDCCVM